MAHEEVFRVDADFGGKRASNLGVPTSEKDGTYTDLRSVPSTDGIPNAGLSLLASPADHVHSYVDRLLQDDPDDVGITYAINYTSGVVTSEVWTRTLLSIPYKRIDYTYSSGLLATETRKVFAVNGSTILGQITITYAYISGLLSGSIQTRDI